MTDSFCFPTAPSSREGRDAVDLFGDLKKGGTIDRSLSIENRVLRRSTIQPRGSASSISSASVTVRLLVRPLPRLRIDEQYLRWSSRVFHPTPAASSVICVSLAFRVINSGPSASSVIKCVGHRPIIVPAATWSRRGLRYKRPRRSP